ncbi:MAG: hypothetical protein K6E60_01360 [Saccharofermentans sp.]|nr:hypothetical protein [Clostridiales bacterium]MCR5339973.1 hypothetical protein [Saccharofermentans sp.]
MSFTVDYDKITVLEVGITSFGNEGYAVKYDFVKKVIQWRDSYMWNNNFTRSLNETDYNTLKEELPKSGMLEWMKGYNSGLENDFGDQTQIPGEWKITVEFEDKTKMTAGAEQHFPKKWKFLKNLIEKTTGCSFILR